MVTTYEHPAAPLSNTFEPVIDAVSEDENRPAWLSYEEFPFGLQTVAVDGESVTYVDEGDGPTLLFVHAGPSWSLLFRDLLVDLRHDFRCITLDFPGFGLSAGSSRVDSNVPQISETLAAFVAELDLTDVTLVTHEIGTVAGFDIARRQPGRVSGIVVLGGFAWSLADQPRIRRMLRFLRTPVFGFVNTTADLLTRVTATRFGAGRRLSAEGRRALRGPTRSRAVRRNVRALLTSIADGDTDAYLADLESSLDDLSVPLLLSFGENDPGRGDGFPERFRSHFPDADEVVIRGANHFPMADAPHTIAGHIAAWHTQTGFEAN